MSWRNAHMDANAAALDTMRQLVPPDVADCSETELIRRGLPAALARRVHWTKALWLLRQHADDVRKTDVADLKARAPPPREWQSSVEK
jgi:hypothetical protein